MSGKAAQVEYLDEIQDKSSLTTYSEARTLREYTSNLEIDRTPQVVRGTGIICTIGMYNSFLHPAEEVDKGGTVSV